MFADELFDIVPSPSPRHPEMFDLILIGEASQPGLADTKHLRSFRAGDKSRTILINHLQKNECDFPNGPRRAMKTNFT